MRILRFSDDGSFTPPLCPSAPSAPNARTSVTSRTRRRAKGLCVVFVWGVREDERAAVKNVDVVMCNLHRGLPGAQPQIVGAEGRRVVASGSEWWRVAATFHQFVEPVRFIPHLTRGKGLDLPHLPNCSQPLSEKFLSVVVVLLIDWGNGHRGASEESVLQVASRTGACAVGPQYKVRAPRREWLESLGRTGGTGWK